MDIAFAGNFCSEAFTVISTLEIVPIRTLEIRWVCDSGTVGFAVDIRGSLTPYFLGVSSLSTYMAPELPNQKVNKSIERLSHEPANSPPDQDHST